MRIGLGPSALTGIGLLVTAIPRGASGLQTPPSIVFLGSTQGIPFGHAGFRIHNPSPNAVFLQRVEVQVLEQGAWRTRTEGGVVPAMELNRGSPFSLICEPGRGQVIEVPWPWESPWRIRLTYQRERTSASWLHRAGQVLRLRNLDAWNSRFWNPSEATEGILVFDPRPDAVGTLDTSPDVHLNLDWKPGVQYFHIPGTTLTPAPTNRVRSPGTERKP